MAPRMPLLVDGETRLRFQSLLAWLDAFNLHSPLLWTDGGRGEHAVMKDAVSALGDGRLILRALDTLTEGDVLSGAPLEQWSLRQCWRTIRRYLRGLNPPVSELCRLVDDGSILVAIEVLQALLAQAIQPGSPGLQLCVQHILSLSTVHQEQLKALIEQQQTRGHQQRDEEEEEEEEEEEQEDKAEGSPQFKDAHCNNGLLVRQLRDQIAELTAQVQSHAQDEAAASERELQARAELDELRQSALSGEVEAMEREQTYKEEIAELERRLGSAEALLSDAEATQQEVAAMKDELDVLRPAAQKYKMAEEQLSKCKRKLEALSDVRDQLVQEQANNATLVEKSLRLERELQQMAALKKQLEGYKHGATETEVALYELRSALEDREKEVATLKQEVNRLGEVVKMAHARSAELEEDLSAFREANGAGMGLAGQGIGDGVSEYNAELMQKMKQLEEDNAHMKAQLEKVAPEKVDAMESQLDDARRLAETFQSKYRSTRAELGEAVARGDRAEADLAMLRSQMENLQREAAEDRRKRDEWASMAEEEIVARQLVAEELRIALAESLEMGLMMGEEISQRTHYYNFVAKRQHAQVEAFAWLASLGSQSLINQLSDELEDVNGQLEAAKAAGATEKQAREGAEHCVHLMKKAMEEANKAAEDARSAQQAASEEEYRRLQAQYLKACNDREAEHTQALTRLKDQMRDYAAGHNVSNEQHYAEVASLQHAISVAQKEAAAKELHNEELKMINIRLEKEKRYILDEAAKGATSNSKTSSSTAARAKPEVERELECLQKEFENLLADHNRHMTAIRLAEDRIGFSLKHFDPLYEEQRDLEDEDDNWKPSRPRQSLSSLSSSGDSGNITRRRGRGALFTPPERVPVPQDDTEAKFLQLREEKRTLLLEKSQAASKISKLEQMVEKLNAKLAESDDTSTSLQLKNARLVRQLDDLQDQMISIKNHMDKENMANRSFGTATMSGGFTFG